jgi:hypothetical protein
MGGLACLKAAAAGAPTAGVATLSAPPEFMGLSIGSEITSVFVPKLYMAGEEDTDAVSEAEVLLRVSSEPRTALTYPGGARGIALLGNQKATSDLLEFIGSALR